MTEWDTDKFAADEARRIEEIRTAIVAMLDPFGGREWADYPRSITEHAVDITSKYVHYEMNMSATDVWENRWPHMAGLSGLRSRFNAICFTLTQL